MWDIGGMLERLTHRLLNLADEDLIPAREFLMYLIQFLRKREAPAIVGREIGKVET